MRRHATGWVVKVLFGILILSFAVWGIGDVLTRPQSGTALAEVAGSDVSEREVMREFDSRYQALQEQAGGGITRHQAVSFGLLNQALDVVVARHVLDAHARDLSLTVAEPEIAGAIRANPLFQGAQGFDRSRLELYLRSIGLTEAGYVAALRQDMLRSRIVDTLTGAVRTPASLPERLLAYRGEERRGRALIVQADQIEVPQPDDAALQAYLDANAKSYEAPEYRKVAILILSADDLAQDISIDDAVLKTEYEARIADYRTPETRSIEQVLASDEATAREAAALVAQGKSLTEAAEALKSKGVERNELGPLRRGDLPEAFDQAVWALAQGGVSEPVQSPFGWHVVKLAEVRPETVRSFEEVKEELATELRRSRANEQLPGFASKLDDEIAAGTSFETAATNLGLSLLQAEAIDRKGQNEKEEAVAADRLTPEILDAVFAGGKGETSLLSETKDGRFFMFRVDDVTPAHPRSLAEVRDALSTAWRGSQQAEKAKARAEELRAKVTDAASFEAAAAEPGLTRRDVGPLGRTDQGFLFGLQPDAVRLMFETQPGAVASRTAPALEGTAVLLVDEVITAAPEPAEIEVTTRSLGDELKTDLLAQYEAALRQRYPVQLNQDRLAALMQAQAQ